MNLQIEQIEFLGWREAYQLCLGEATMVVVAEVGPRILSLSVGDGANLLFVDPETAGQGQGDTDFNVYGGHRIWVSPETADTYTPDNASCEVDVSDNGLTVIAPVTPQTGLRKRLTVSAQDGRFVIEQGVLNTGNAVYPGAVWALTCVVPKGVVVFPWGRQASWDLKKIVYWNEWMGQSSDVNSPQWQPGPDLFTIRPTGEVGKVGSNSPEGWVALCRDDATFVKSYDWVPDVYYPDEDCSLQTYTCAHFIEMETLSPLTTFYPDQEVVHREVWTVTAQAIDPADGAALRSLV
ncbi:MAG: hypothetical protein GY832_23135 [Chloroflexi bacterium]|nr:hypothetical protein [Chloroflexota bacterium]